MQEQARRAIAVCTNSSIVTAGICIGATIGPVGAAVGGALSTPLGIAAEAALKTTITAERIKACFQDVTIRRTIYEALRNALAAGTAGCLGNLLGGLVKFFGEVASFALVKR